MSAESSIVKKANGIAESFFLTAKKIEDAQTQEEMDLSERIKKFGMPCGACEFFGTPSDSWLTCSQEKNPRQVLKSGACSKYQKKLLKQSEKDGDNGGLFPGSYPFLDHI